VVPPDEGDIWRYDTLRIAHLEQEVPPDTEETIYEVVAVGLGELGELLTEYHQVTHEAGAGEHPSLQRMAELQARIMLWVAGTSVRK
jgi:ATP-binding cassette subfamily F protein uup